MVVYAKVLFNKWPPYLVGLIDNRRASGKCKTIHPLADIMAVYLFIRKRWDQRNEKKLSLLPIGERLGTFGGHNGTVWTVAVDCEAHFCLHRERDCLIHHERKIITDYC